MKKQIPKIIGFTINILCLFSPALASKIAIYLFSKPRKGHLKENQKQDLEAAIKRDLIFKNMAIKTYHWVGDKETILLAHGWESNSARWRDLVSILRKLNYNIIALDAPAHGDSGNQTFNALLYSECIHAALEIFETDIVIGHSVGGTASAIAIHNNNHSSIKKLILLGAPSNFVGIIDNYINMMGYTKNVAKSINKYFVKHFGYLPEHFTIANFSKNIDAEVLIIHDKKDKVIPFKDALEIKKHFEKHKLIKTTGFGHSLRTKEVYNHIIEFISD